MDILNIVSAGAAQAVVERIARRFEQGGGCAVHTRFGAVQSMNASVLAGAPADVIVLTRSLIDSLAASRWVVAGSRADLGSVGTALAVRAGGAAPDVSSPEALRAALLASHRVWCPDPAVATAGKVFLQTLQTLGIGEAMQPRLQHCPSGSATLAALAAGPGAGEIGVAQITEIIAGVRASVGAGLGIALAGPLPAALQQAAIYSVGLATRSAVPVRALAFIQALLEDRAALREAGFADCNTVAAV